jgi:DNA-binding NarL/FixJ family response regulator
VRAAATSSGAGRRRMGMPTATLTPRVDGLAALSHRERQVLALMALGRSNRGIADDLLVSEGAVEKHVANIFVKLGLRPEPGTHRRVQAVLAYVAAG